MQTSETRCIYVIATYLCIQMYVFMALCGHTYPYIQPLGDQELYKTSLQGINSQEASVYYIKLKQLLCSST